MESTLWEDASTVDTTFLTPIVLKPTCVSYTPGMHIIGGILCVMIVASNLLTIVTMLKSKEKIGSKNRLYVISLACADILLAPAFGLELILSQMGYLCNQGRAPVNVSLTIKKCHLVAIMFLRIMSFGVSQFSLLSIGIDRLLAISIPLWYRVHATSIRIKVALIITWFYFTSFCTCVMTVYVVQVKESNIQNAYNFDSILPVDVYNYFILPHVYLLSIPGNIICYAVSYIVIKRHGIKMIPDTANGNHIKRIRRFFRMMLVTLITLVILYIPFIIAFKVFDVPDPQQPSWVHGYVGQPVLCMLVSNSWMNPLLYSWLNVDYRRAYLKVLCFNQM